MPAEGEEIGTSPGPSVPVTTPTDVQPLIVRSKQRTRMGILAVCFVILLVLAAVIGATVTGHSSSEGHAPLASPAASESLAAKLTGVPESVFESVGLPTEIVTYPTKITGLPALRDTGLPELLWIGAEYCPFCASERWSMVMALSKFGTFAGLRTSYSSASDFAPDTPTLDFSHATFTSRYLVFRHYELATNRPAASSTACNVNGYACLQTPPDSDTELFETVGGGSIPFMDFGNGMQQSGAGFEDQPLVLAGLTFNQIAQDLYTAASAVAQVEDGSANYMTAAICMMTGNEPRSACSSTVVKQAEARENASNG